MTFLLLRQSNTGELAAVNADTITHVTAKPFDDDPYVTAPSKLYLSIRHVGSDHQIRYVPVTVDGDEDPNITDADEAVKAFSAAVWRFGHS